MSNKSISYKQIGQNMNVVINGKRLTKKMTEKSDRENLKEKIINYNNKNSASLEKEILSILTSNAESSKEKFQKIKKVAEKVEKLKNVKNNSVKELTLSDLEEKEELTPKEIERLSKLLSSHVKTPEPVKRTQRRGEY